MLKQSDKSENKQQNPSITNIKQPLEAIQKKTSDKVICSECDFQVTIQLSKEIMSLKQTIEWYQRQTNLIEQFSQPQQTQLLETQTQVEKQLSNFQTAINKEILLQSEADRQLKHFEMQLAHIQSQLRKQEAFANEHIDKCIQIQQTYLNIQSDSLKNQHQYRQLLSQYHNSLCYKEQQMKSTISLFSTTNFISILYSISFQNNDSFLNGQKISFDNIWKVVEILVFYQSKYSQYHPLAHICWSEMKLETQMYLPKSDNQEINYGEANISILKSITTTIIPSQEHQINEIDIDCDNEKAILQTWMPYFLLEVKSLFQFLNKESGHNYKLTYEVDDFGKFQRLKCTFFKDEHEKFNRILKCLLTDIDQINKLQFFAKQKRIKTKM